VVAQNQADVIESHKPDVRCPLCGTTQMPLSMFRWPDFLPLRTMRRAVPCRTATIGAS
jgi:hypothetical protein